MTLRLYVFPPSPRSFKVVSLVRHLCLDHELCVVDLSKGENHEESYASINPNRRAPALEEDGFTLWEANAILQYLALKRPESRLLPADPARRAHVLQWQCWDLAHWEPACAPLIFERSVKALFNLGEPDAAIVSAALDAFTKVASILDRQLAIHEFATGSELTVADFSLGAVLNISDMAGIPVHEYPNVHRWYQRLTLVPGWREAMVSPPCNRLEPVIAAA
jgi:glutathione S-transferase